MNPLYLLIVLIVLVIVAIIRSFDWRDIAARWVGYKPERAKICIRSGMHVRVAIGERIWTGVEGQMYSYKLKGEKYWNIAIIKPDYPHIENQGYRLIGMTDGMIISDPLGFFDENEQKKYRESVTDISAMVHGEGVVKAIRSLKSNKVQNWLTYIIVAFLVIAAGYYFLHNKQGAVMPLSENVTANVTTVTSNNTEIKVGEIVPYTPTPEKVIP